MLALVEELRAGHLAVHSVKPGDVYYDKDGSRFESLYAFDGVNTPVGKTDINGMSLILLLTHSGVRALFTGDLNDPIGAYLAKSGHNLKADILKVPHHGADPLASNDFFDTVGPRMALVPAPSELWLSERSKRAREYFAARKTKTYVNGIHGHVTVTIFSGLFSGRYEVKGERE